MAGPDGNLWFTEPNDGNSIGRITTSGKITEFPIPEATGCVGPKLKGKTLAGAKRALVRAHCALGIVTRPRSSRRRAVVIGQRPDAVRSVPVHTKVAVVLG